VLGPTFGLLAWLTGHAPPSSPTTAAARSTLAAPPQRVVTLSAVADRDGVRAGACARLVGTDRYSNWPAAVQALPKLGGLDDAQIERIVALKPDLVLAATSTRAVERLESLGLRGAGAGAAQRAGRDAARHRARGAGAR
jgi:iron complex transport system substrate-binding protein